MVVRFPSDPFGGEQGDARTDESGVTGGEHLAPVTPLRRPTAPRGGGTQSSRHPAGSGRAAALAKPEPAGEVVELPGSTRWNNTWGDDGRPAASRPETRSTPTEPEDDEADRQSKKVSAVTIRQLARRGMSRWELEQVLIKREIEPEVFGPELDRLETLGVIDDASLAVSLAFTQHSRKGLGRSSIEQDLKRRHIDPELIEIALADIADEDELERATELAVKRIGQLSSYDEETARRRLHGFLARKGYSSSIVRQAMDAAFASRRRGGVRFQ
ncbi:regulatory protein RecX [Leifsonia sp. 71-9]|uniref:regulatory protein RecX n=1 Tax=Leifsonia sp. 71-9 TaxID=1895934 RepID=UPI000B2D0096|nr:regulatory protein RecX [Leifsonia sp. 71-9]